MKIQLLVELESNDDFDMDGLSTAIEMAVAESIPSLVTDEDGNVLVEFSSFCVSRHEVAA